MIKLTVTIQQVTDAAGLHGIHVKLSGDATTGTLEEQLLAQNIGLGIQAAVDIHMKDAMKAQIAGTTTSHPTSP